MRSVFYIIILTKLILLTSCSNEENEFTFLNSPERSDILFDIQYGNEENQKFDIYLPKNRSVNKTKSIVLIHGGGWIGGDKSDMFEMFNVLIKSLPNYAIININYRLANDEIKIFPSQIQDINNALEYVKNSNFHISNKFAIIGASAGGHLALYYSYKFNQNSDIKLVCSVVGPTDLTDDEIMQNEQFKQVIERAIGVSKKESPEIYQELSPLYHVTENTIPTALFYGNDDPMVPVNQATNLRNSLRENNIVNVCKIYNGGHGNWSTEDIEDYKRTMINFITTNF